MKKKVIALILTAVMCLGILPVTASAATVGETHTVTFNALKTRYEGCVIKSGDTITVTNGDKWDLPDPAEGCDPEYEEYLLGRYGWYMCSYDRVYNGTVIDLDSDIILYARNITEAESCKKDFYEKPGRIRPPCFDDNHNHPRVTDQTVTIPDKIIVSFDSPETWYDKPYAPVLNFNYKNVKYGEPYGELPAFSKSEGAVFKDMVFYGWYTEPVGGTQVTESTIVTETTNHTLYPRYTLYPSIYTPADIATDSSTDSSTASEWAQAEVSEATQSGLVPSDLRSAYTSAITREEFCRLMVALVEANSGKDIASYVASQGKTMSAPFTDTSAQEVNAAYTLGIVNGTSATTFNPKGTITRQEAAAMLERTAKVLGISSNGTGMSFSDNAADWAKSSVSFVSGCTDPVSGSSVMGGVGNGRFDPYGTYTREQAIVTTLRLFHCA